MSRILVFAYGVVAYLIFLGSFLYAIGFVGGLVVPKTIDSGLETAAITAILIDLRANRHRREGLRTRPEVDRPGLQAD